MRRREFIGLLAAIAISPQAVLAQTTKKNGRLLDGCITVNPTLSPDFSDRF